MGFEALVVALPKLIEVNDSIKETNSERYELETTATSPEEWWNKSNDLQRCHIGNICVDYGYMTPNCGWWNDGKLYNEIGKLQQKRVRFAFEKRNDGFMMLNFHCLMGSYKR